MSQAGPKAVSVTLQGEDDGWRPAAGYLVDRDPQVGTRLVVQVAPTDLAAAHQRLLRVLDPPLGFLYRQLVDRRTPRPEGAPPRDHVGMDLGTDEVLHALRAAEGLVYHDARAEFWVRGRLGDQVVLDADGLVFLYPDDPAFRDALAALAIPEREVETLADRDYVKHWFHAGNDVSEDRLVEELGLVEASPQR